MNVILILIAALLPAVLLLMYIWKKDPQSEPNSWLVKAVLLGVGICIPISIVELGLQAILFGIDGGPTTIFGTTIGAFVVAALPEELFKLLALWLILRKNPYFDEHFDGIVYAVFIGLGFAAIENVVYLFSNDQWITVAITRALLAVPGHYSFAVLMGYYYSIYHFVDHSSKAATRILLIPVLFHGVYDALAFSGTINPTLGGICFLVLIYFCFKMHKLARIKITEQIKRDQTEG